MLLSVILQYFNMSSNIDLLARWKDCANVELLVNVDSRYSGDIRWLSTRADVVLFSRNIHEIRAYNRLARIAKGDVLAFVQDDAAPPMGCEYLATVSRLYEHDPRLSMIGMNVGTTTPWNHRKHERLHSARFFTGNTMPSVERVEYVACADIGPLLVRKSDFFSLGEFDEKFSEEGQGGVGLDFDLSTRAWINNMTVLLYKPPLLPGIHYPDGVHARKKAVYWDKSREIREYQNQKFKRFKPHYDWISEEVRRMNTGWATSFG